MRIGEAWNKHIVATVKTWGRAANGSAEEGPNGGVRGVHSAPRFTELQPYKYIKKVERGGRVLGLESPFFRRQEGRIGSRAMVEGRPRLNFAWCNYLGLNEHPAVAEAARAAIDRYGTCVSASRMVAGEIPIHATLERRIAEFCGVEDTLLFVSGHAANVSTIGTVMNEDDLVVHDALVHNSAAVGIRLSGATSRSFRHNDADACEAILRESRARHRNALVVIEGLYSTEGDIPDLARFIDIKERYGAWLMVDDAHSIGVLGKRGRGCAEHCGVDPRKVDIWMGTLSKALASCGGFIGGSEVLIEILRYSAPGFVYSVGLPPPMTAAALAALDVLEAEPERVARLHANSALFLSQARSAGLDTGKAEGYGIVPVIVGSTFKLGKLEKRLFERDLMASPIFPPGVPINGGRLRFFLTSEHTESEIGRAVSMLSSELGRG
ncbi:MAG TPA: aminotransferase class I/II-fold pyridoxal phosphate-dependent enzyme [Hyphomicrobiaceae bacterium]|nr:aminotransferase class I/II-fold pyridoxal phosphate-dependent enzyme [Hyphomicrobiaceae bacterium]